MGNQMLAKAALILARFVGFLFVGPIYLAIIVVFLPFSAFGLWQYEQRIREMRRAGRTVTWGDASQRVRKASGVIVAEVFFTGAITGIWWLPKSRADVDLKDDLPAVSAAAFTNAELEAMRQGNVEFRTPLSPVAHDARLVFVPWFRRLLGKPSRRELQDIGTLAVDRTRWRKVVYADPIQH